MIIKDVEKYIKIIALISSFLMLGNIILYFVVNVINKFQYSLERKSLLFWTSLLPLFIIGSQLKDQVYVPFLTMISIVSFIAVRGFVLGESYKKDRMHTMLIISFSLFFVSIISFNFTSNIIASAILISLGLNIFVSEVFYSCIWELKEKNIYQKIMTFILVLGFTNNCIPILGQIDIKFDLIGWFSALLLYQVISIMFPLLILQARKEEERDKIATEVRLATQSLVLEKMELSSRHKEATVLAKENQALLNALSHDIANPVQIISMLVKKLKKLVEGDDSEKLVVKVERHINTLSDFIAMSKSQRQLISKKNVLELNEVSIFHCIQECKALNIVSLQKKSICLTINNNLRSESTFLANESTFILSILNNILSNAIKFTSKQGLIEITVNEIDQNIVIEVQDSGKGIDAKILSEINANGFCSSTVGTDGEKGSGFGISNVFRYVKQYHGSIEFSSNTIGAHVRISFPVFNSNEVNTGLVSGHWKSEHDRLEGITQTNTIQ